MRGTNNSMETLLHDQTSEHQRDDKDHFSRETLPSKPCGKMVTEEEPSYLPLQIARTHNPFKRFRHSHRTLWIIIQDIEATKKFHKHADYKHRNAKSSVNALERLIHQYGLQHKHKNKAGVICQPSGESLRKNLQTIWGRRKSEDVRPSKTIWLASKQDWDSSYLRMIEDSCTELTLEESLPVYDSAHAEPFNTDASEHDEKKGVRFGRAGANEDKRSNGVAGAREGDLESETEESALESIIVSPMVIFSPLTQSPTTEPQNSCHKNCPPKVCLKTHLVIIEADTTYTSSDCRIPQVKSVLINRSAPQMSLESRHPMRKVRVRSAKRSRSLHTRAAAVVKSQKLLILINSS
jgi:hypothetical protein